LDFLHHINNKIIKLQRFGSWILLSSSYKKEKKAKNITVEPPGPVQEAESSFLEVVIVLFYNSDNEKVEKNGSTARRAPSPENFRLRTHYCIYDKLFAAVLLEGMLIKK
jgi:hypothetical protein